MHKNKIQTLQSTSYYTMQVRIAFSLVINLDGIDECVYNYLPTANYLRNVRLQCISQTFACVWPNISQTLDETAYSCNMDMKR